jgi:hypothetical protein
VFEPFEIGVSHNIKIEHPGLSKTAKPLLLFDLFVQSEPSHCSPMDLRAELKVSARHGAD